MNKRATVGSYWAMLRLLRFLPVLLMLAVFGCNQGLSEGVGSLSSSSTDWRGAALNDLSTGESFSISDFTGKVVVLETMAVWCPTCVRQQIEVRALGDIFGEEVVAVTLDVDLHEDEAILRRHVRANGFPEGFAVSPVALSRALEREFGNIVLNPASTPVIIVDRDQGGHLLGPGLKSAAELAAEVRKYL